MGGLIKMAITIWDAQRINEEKGEYFFSSGAMRFFRSKIETKGNLIGDRLFITSEQFVPLDGKPDPRKYTIRSFDKETGSVDTVGEFNKIPDKKIALDIANCIVNENLDYEKCKAKVWGGINGL